ncbi:hypothetical protein [Flavobacterium sp.]|nr:hypothetical protein [Flavobacterium sp.]|tara:strand:+ start:1037 stop:1171 length:135 start_codon:yes stop_codon:yes gene_type:complete
MKNVLILGFFLGASYLIFGDKEVKIIETSNENNESISDTKQLSK